MFKEEHDEIMYELSIAFAKTLYKKQLITIDEFNDMNRILLEKYHPFIGELFSLKDLIS